eukprot:7150386-Pyramimonas_sp.AAC.1
MPAGGGPIGRGDRAYTCIRQSVSSPPSPPPRAPPASGEPGPQDGNGSVDPGVTMTTPPGVGAPGVDPPRAEADSRSRTARRPARACVTQSSHRE